MSLCSACLAGRNFYCIGRAAAARLAPIEAFATKAASTEAWTGDPSLNVDSRLGRASEIAYFILRVVSGFLMMQSGSVILFGWFGGMPGGAKLNLMSQTGLGGIIEFFCAVLVLIGLLTRPAAILLSGTMAVAYFQFHQPNGNWPLQNQGLPPVLFCFIFLYIAATGAGRWSVDSLLRRRR
jgi:putative oxidoreductase